MSGCFTVIRNHATSGWQFVYGLSVCTIVQTFDEIPEHLHEWASKPVSPVYPYGEE